MRTLPTKRLILALFALSLGLAGCAGGGGGGSSPRRGSSTSIDSEELATVAALDLYDAVRRLRPRWLRAGASGILPSVIIDGSPQSQGLDILRSYRATDVAELRFMNSSDATTRYGTGHAGGAIIVNTRH